MYLIYYDLSIHHMSIYLRLFDLRVVYLIYYVLSIHISTTYQPIYDYRSIYYLSIHDIYEYQSTYDLPIYVRFVYLIYYCFIYLYGHGISMYLRFIYPCMTYWSIYELYKIKIRRVYASALSTEKRLEIVYKQLRLMCCWLRWLK